MRKSIIIIVVVVLLILGVSIGYKYYKKAKDAKKLVIGINSFYFQNSKLNSLAGITELIMNITSMSLPAILEIKITNFSQSKYTVNNIFVEAYASDNDLVAKPQTPFSGKLIIEPGGSVVFKLPYNITTFGLESVVKSLNPTGKVTNDSIKNLLIKYVTTGKMGATLNLKGYVNAEGFTFIDIPINEKIEI